MKVENKKLLPIGSVVMLKNGKKKVMITGFCVNTPEDENKMYDYCGCMYPEGVISSSKTLLFNHEQIDKIYYIGYSDEEDKEFKKEFLGDGLKYLQVIKCDKDCPKEVSDAIDKVNENFSQEVINIYSPSYGEKLIADFEKNNPPD